MRRTRTFGRDVAFRAHKRLSFIDRRDEADVRQLGHAVDEDDVRGLDITVDQAVPVQVLQGVRQGEAEFEALRNRQTTAGTEVGAERARRVGREIKSRSWTFRSRNDFAGALLTSDL